MFGKSDDKWIEIAFGEQKLPENFSAKNADDAEVLKSYELLREDLQLLKDIPEMQFSNERLRDAILAAGPKASAQTPWVMRWGWAVAPVAAMLAIGVVFLKGNFSGADPRVIVPSTSLQNSAAVASNMEIPLSERASEKPSQNPLLTADDSDKPVMVVAKSRPKGGTARRALRGSGVRLAMASNPTAAKKTPGAITTSIREESVSVSRDVVAEGMGLTRDSGGNQATVTADAMMAPAKAEAAGNVILIDASSDSVTGLPNATEVSKNSEKVALGG